MTKRSIALILLAYGACITACGTDRVVDPRVVKPPAAEPSVLTEVRIKPAPILLLPGMKTPLTVGAWDQHGREVTRTADAATYSSSNPAAVTVSDRGIVTAVSPGTAVISTTLTLNGISATGSVIADVLEVRPGNYQLTAPIRESGWGVSGEYTALLALWQDPFLTAADDAVIGTFASLRLIGLDGTTEQSVPGGLVKTRVDFPAGKTRLVIQLVVGQIVWWEGSIGFSSEHDGFEGPFAVGDGLAAGWFTAKRIGD